MRLLITTQVVDANDPYLGFFEHWLGEFARRFESIEVICLSEGLHTLPTNVHVHSLGKEKGGNRFLYALRFIILSWKLRHRYDAVFVHMNPEYVLLAGDIWKLMGKRIGLWYNHEIGSLALRLIAPFVDIIFHTSPYAYTARYAKARRMPAGIDTDLFAPHGAHERTSLYFQARITPAKRQHIALAALRIVRTTVAATLTLVGPEDSAYVKRLREDYADLIDAGAVRFLGPKRNDETPVLYAVQGVALNLTADGNFDKSVLEAMATETPVVVGSRAFSDLLAPEWIVSPEDSDALAAALLRLIQLPEAAYRALGAQARAKVAAHHSLSALADALKAAYTL